MEGAALRARVMGAFEVDVGDRVLAASDWPRTSAGRLVKLLLVTPGHRVSREGAAESLWPERPPGAAQAELRKALHFARRALDGARLLDADRSWVSLTPDLDLDLDRLMNALAASGDEPRGGPAHRGAPPDPQVLDLGRRVLLPDDGGEPWVVEARERVRRAWEAYALPAARQLHAEGDRAEAHAIVDAVLARDPTDEAAHRLAIELFASEGRHHAARRQLEICRAALRSELDVEPTEETVEALAAAEVGAMAAVPGIQPAVRLVGRGHELEQIETALRQARTGGTGAILIRGPAGIGKSRVLHEAVLHARARGWRVLEWQAIESATRSAYAPLRVGLASELIASDVDTWDEPGRSALGTIVPGVTSRPVLRFADEMALVSGIVGALAHFARRRPLVLAWDDLPWLDRASLSVIEALAAARPAVPLVVLVSARDDEAVPDPAPALLDRLRRTGGTEVRLEPMSASELAAIVVDRLGGTDVEAGLARDLRDRSRGNPLFGLELVHAWREAGSVSLVDGRWTRLGSIATDAAPESVRLLVARRLARLTPGERTILAIASELPAHVPFRTLQGATRMPAAELIAALDAGLQAGLIVEQRGGYAFAHPLYRIAMRTERGPARRAQTRLDIAAALAGVDPTDEPAVLADAASRSVDPVPVAEHALAAWDLGAVEALPIAVAFGLAAGVRLRRLFDHTAAMDMLERALAGWASLAPALAAAYDASGGWIALGEARVAAGDDGGGAEAFRRSVAAARSPDDVAAAHIAMYWLPYRHGDFPAAFAMLEEALEVLPAGAALARAQVRREMGWCLLRMRRQSEAVAVLEDVLALFEAQGDRSGVMRTLDMLGCAAWAAGDAEGSVELLDQSLAIALELGDLSFENHARVHLVVSLGLCGRFDLARRHCDRALELCRAIGDRYDESVANWMAAELEDLAGEPDASVAFRREQLRLLDAMGGNPRNEAWAHAHLAVIARHRGDADMERREAAEARAAAARSSDQDDSTWIEDAITVDRWADVRLS